MEKLDFTVKTINEVDYHDFEQFVRKVYKAKDYDFVSTQEGNNYSKYEFNPDGNISKYDEKGAIAIRNGKIDTFQNHLLFNCLVADKFIEPGCYIIDVSW